MTRDAHRGFGLSDCWVSLTHAHSPVGPHRHRHLLRPRLAGSWTPRSAGLGALRLSHVVACPRQFAAGAPLPRAPQAAPSISGHAPSRLPPEAACRSDGCGLWPIVDRVAPVDGVIQYDCIDLDVWFLETRCVTSVTRCGTVHATEEVRPMAWPTTNNPRNNFVTLRLTDDEADDLDWLQAQTGGKNRSDTARSAFHRVVAAERKRAAKQKKASAPGAGMLDPTHEDPESDGE